MLLALHTGRPTRSGGRKSFTAILSQIRNLALAVLSWPGRVARHRALMGRMAAMSDYELADIGLSRQDVSDATAVALDHDPSALLMVRAEERRRHPLR
jgi:uncharacterized protein YjiS (DUF1127 family)